MLECPVCGGAGCGDCDNRGTFEVTQCARRIVPAEIWEVMELAELYEKGLPPVAGGALDQSGSFVEACRFIWNEQARWKGKLGIWW